MAQSSYDQMISGEWYNALTPELDALRMAARRAVFAHNTCPPDDRGGMVAKLAALFMSVGENCLIESPFHTAYGCNTVLGDGVFFNAGVAILDSARVTIGSRCMLGPKVQIYCADHHREIAKRRAGIERALPVTLGEDAWIGGGCNPDARRHNRRRRHCWRRRCGHAGRRPDGACGGQPGAPDLAQRPAHPIV